MRLNGWPGRQIRATYAGFAVFGGFWGTWGASIPQIRDQAGVTVGELGTALLFVGAGALPAMLLTGRLVDRWGRPAAAALLALLGLVGVAVAVTARDLTSLSIGLAVLGASSGAADVAINTAAGSAQQASGRQVITRAHAAFSLAVVVSSLLTGALLGRGASLAVPFVLLAVVAVAAAVALLLGADRHAGSCAVRELRGAGRHGLVVAVGPLLALGVLGAVAFAVENGHQSWSALYLRDAAQAGPVTAAAGPAVFAGTVAVARLAASSLAVRHATAVLVTGSLTAATGTALVGAASTVPASLLGLGIAAAGTAVLFPTLLGVLNSRVPEHSRGTATSVVTAVAYLGFLAGPVYVGSWASGTGLSAAMFALAALAAILAPLAAVRLRLK
ncbi:MAG TPA: MFS transporter, partial [Cryptosporangiaceae bacterium]|nr:MFS transporter [Cryptosporangiaceae bacterium]